MKVSFDIDQEAIAKICRSEVKLAAEVLAKKAIASENLTFEIKAALSVSIKQIIEEQLALSDSALCRYINSAIEKYVPEYISNYLSNTKSLMLADITKEVVYSEKQTILDSITERATAELVRKGLGKVVANCMAVITGEEEA